MATNQNRIYKRVLANGDTRWDARAYFVDPVPKKISQPRKTFKTRKEAKSWLAEQRVGIDRGTIVVRNVKTVAELMTFWLENHIKHHVSAKTYVGYEGTVRLHINPKLGVIPVQQLTSAHIQTFFTEKIKEGCGTRTVRLCHLNLSQALDLAVDNKWVPRNVADV